MHKIALIIEREYMSIVARKSFIIMTLLIPVLLVILGALPVWLSEATSDSTTERKTLAVIDETGRLQDVIKPSPLFQVVPMKGEPGKTNPAQFMRQAGESIDALVVIPADVQASKQVKVYSYSTTDQSLTDYINTSLSDTITAINMAALGVTQEQLDEAQADVDVQGVKLTAAGGESSSSSEVAMVIGMVLSLVIYGFVLSYGAMIINSVVEEKTNRIVEVIVSSCKPFELMMGKIIGVGLVGLTQFAIWAVLLGIGSVALGAMLPGADVAATATAGPVPAPDAATVTADVLAAVQSINLPWVLTCFVIFFIGGYLLYASLFAGLGSAVDNSNDAGQFMMPVIIVMIIALYVGIGCMENPNSSMAVWCSIIPFTSPVVMMVRLPYSVPAWQMALSIVLLFATAVGCVWLSARIYRTGILRYGKKFTFRDILSWIK